MNPKKFKIANYVKLDIDDVLYIITDNIKHINEKETSGVSTVSLKLIFNITIILPRILQKNLYLNILFLSAMSWCETSRNFTNLAVFFRIGEQ